MSGNARTLEKEWQTPNVIIRVRGANQVVRTSVSSTTYSLSQIQLATVHCHKPHVNEEDCGRMFPAPKCYELPEAA
jgi:hypothetical protein